MPFDLFGRDRMIYTFKYTCQEEPDLQLEDGAKRIFLNTKGKKGARKELRDMLKYIEESTQENVVSKDIEVIHNLVTAVKNNEKVGEDYMLSLMREMTIRTDALEEGIEQGREQGIEQGIKRGREQGIEQGIKRGREQGIEQGRKMEAQKIVLALIDTLDIQTISEKTGLSVEEIENMKKEESQS